jgi:hypothetical protein
MVRIPDVYNQICCALSAAQANPAIFCKNATKIFEFFDVLDFVVANKHQVGLVFKQIILCVYFHIIRQRSKKGYFTALFICYG